MEFLDFGCFQDFILGGFWIPEIPCSVGRDSESHLVSILESNLVVLGFSKPGFRIERTGETEFRISRLDKDFGIRFSWICKGLGESLSVFFAALKTCLKTQRRT